MFKFFFALAKDKEMANNEPKKSTKINNQRQPQNNVIVRKQRARVRCECKHSEKKNETFDHYTPDERTAFAINHTAKFGREMTKR